MARLSAIAASASAGSSTRASWRATATTSSNASAPMPTETGEMVVITASLNSDAARPTRACRHKLSEMPDIPAARNTLRVLGYLARRSGPVRASTLARDLAMPRSSVYQLIAVMMDEGFLVHYPEDRAYGLSTLLSDIGTSSLRTTRLGRLAQPLLDRLVA